MSNPINDVYVERNKVIALATKLAQEWFIHAYRAPHVGEPFEDGWNNVIFIELPTGQVSWHIHDSEIYLFQHLPVRANAWDKHTTEEKYQRLVDFVSGPQSDGK
jgi:hypothetical protein